MEFQLQTVWLLISNAFQNKEITMMHGVATPELIECEEIFEIKAGIYLVLVFFVIKMFTFGYDVASIPLTYIYFFFVCCWSTV